MIRLLASLAFGLVLLTSSIAFAEVRTVTLAVESNKRGRPFASQTIDSDVP